MHSFKKRGRTSHATNPQTYVLKKNPQTTTVEDREKEELRTRVWLLMLCAAAHQLAHTMPATVEADKRIKAMLYYCSMILRAYQSICSAEPRPGMGGWQGGSRAQSRALPRREWNGTGRAAGASAGEPPGTKENKAANPGLTPLIPATPAPAAPPPPSLSGFPLPHFLLFTMLHLRSRRRSLRYSRARAPPNPATLQLITVVVTTAAEAPIPAAI